MAHQYLLCELRPVMPLARLARWDDVLEEKTPEPPKSFLKIGRRVATDATKMPTPGSTQVQIARR